MRKLSKREISVAFEQWVEASGGAVLGESSGLGTDHPYVLVDVFVMSVTPSINLLDGNMERMEEKYTFPIGRVLAVGDRWQGPSLVGGDLVRLRDDDARTVINPGYEAWENNEYSKSNLKKVGDAPPKFLQNLWKHLWRRLFTLNVFEVDADKLGHVFYMDMGHVLMKIDLDYVRGMLKLEA